jgi:hypothetical protein
MEEDCNCIIKQNLIQINIKKCGQFVKTVKNIFINIFNVIRNIFRFIYTVFLKCLIKQSNLVHKKTRR